jgi:hypothetical protein
MLLDVAKITHVDDVKGVADFFRGFLNPVERPKPNGHHV